MEKKRSSYSFEAKLMLIEAFRKTKQEVDDGKRHKFTSQEEAFAHLCDASGVKAHRGCLLRIIKAAGATPSAITVNNTGKHFSKEGKASVQSQLDSLRQEVEVLKSQVANLQPSQ